MCGFPSLDRVLEGQLIDKEEWIHWDAKRHWEQPVGGASEMESSASETDSVEANFDTDSEVDLESLMESDDNGVSDVDDFDWENYPLPESIDDLRAQLLTPVGMSTNSPANSPQHVPANYRPATPIYSYLPRLFP